MSRSLRKQLTIWVVQGEIAALMLARRVLIWAMIKTRARAVVKQAQREHFRNRVEEAMRAHPSHPDYDGDYENFREWRMREDDTPEDR